MDKPFRGITFFARWDIEAVASIIVNEMFLEPVGIYTIIFSLKY